MNARVNCLHLPNNSLRSYAIIAFHHNKEEHLFVNPNLFSEIRPGVDIKTNSPRNPADNCRVEILLYFSPDHDCCNLQICCHPSKICRRIFFLPCVGGADDDIFKDTKEMQQHIGKILKYSQ